MGSIHSFAACRLCGTCRPVRAPPESDFSKRAQLYHGICGRRFAVFLPEEPPLKPLRLNINEFHLSGTVKDPVRDPVRHGGTGHRGDGFLNAFHMRNIQRGIDIDSGFQQFFDVLIASHVPGVLSVQVGELVDQDQIRMPGQTGI